MNGARLDERRFPGRQGRIVFAYLVVQKGRPVPRDEFAQLLWGDDLPATWEKALRVLMTKLRALFEECGLDGSSALTSASGCYQLTLPPDAWIDVDAAAGAIERAEAALASGELDDACEQAATAAELARRSFLPGEDGPWVEEQRRNLRDLLVRALECLRDASLAAGAGKSADAVRYAAEITELEPFRESSYRALMQAHADAGNSAEALRVYERLRCFLSEELGAYPSPESEAVYLEILRSSPGRAESHTRSGEDGPSDEPPPPTGEAPPPRGRRRRRAFVAGGLLAAMGATVAALAVASPDGPVELLPASLVRLDPKTLKPTDDIRIGNRADMILDSGGYIWVTHGVLRYGSGGHTNKYGVRMSGDHTLERINPTTHEIDPVSGGLDPCGMTPDPSGDVWVTDCYADESRKGDIVLVNARTRNFGRPITVPNAKGFVRGMIYGGRSLWLDGPPGSRAVLRLNPRTGRYRSIKLTEGYTPGGLAWSDFYNDLWMMDWNRGAAVRMHAESHEQQATEAVGTNPAAVLVLGDEVWIGDWNNAAVTHFSAVRPDLPVQVSLKVTSYPAGVTSLAAGGGYIWATVPDDHALWRIDPRGNKPPKRIFLKSYPWGVAYGNDGLWVTLRAHDGPNN